jgi:hypothetical protein
MIHRNQPTKAARMSHSQILRAKSLRLRKGSKRLT